MSDKTKIEWADATWNPVTGCSKVSEGCRNCYAMKFAERWRGTPGHYFEKGFDVTLRPDKLEQPLKWKRPRRIFVNSMSDLFHDDVPLAFISEVFFVMAEANWHTFQLLTKRPERMKKVLDWLGTHMDGRVYNGTVISWPLPNVWLGVSVENQKAADERIPLLIQMPAAVRFLSCEPLLGPVDLNAVPRPDNAYFAQRGETGCITDPNEPDDYVYWHKRDQINWVIAGGESGPGARPMHPDWVRYLRDQCQVALVPFFFKQWGEWVQVHELRCNEPGIKGRKWFNFDPDTAVCKIGKEAAGRMLDGRTWDEFPEGET